MNNTSTCERISNFSEITLKPCSSRAFTISSRWRTKRRSNHFSISQSSLDLLSCEVYAVILFVEYPGTGFQSLIVVYKLAGCSVQGNTAVLAERFENMPNWKPVLPLRLQQPNDHQGGKTAYKAGINMLAGADNDRAGRELRFGDFRGIFNSRQPPGRYFQVRGHSSYIRC